MKSLIYILILLSHISFAQSNDEFLLDFLFEDELNSKNVLANYNQFDFSGLWTQTINQNVLGIIGDEHQRIKIKLLSINKEPSNPDEYLVKGKSCVKGIVCDFSGTITLTKVEEVKELHFGVDGEYADKGIKSQGILIANYEFKETRNQKNSGTFKGQLYSKWYLNSYNQVKYDNIQSISDGYMNNAYIGTWISYSTGKEKKCNWADYRVPKVDQGFDVGAGEFSPSQKYYNRGWENYQKAWLDGDVKAREEELEHWWE